MQVLGLRPQCAITSFSGPARTHSRRRLGLAITVASLPSPAQSGLIQPDPGLLTRCLGSAFNVSLQPLRPSLGLFMMVPGLSPQGGFAPLSAQPGPIHESAPQCGFPVQPAPIYEGAWSRPSRPFRLSLRPSPSLCMKVLGLGPQCGFAPISGPTWAYI